MFGLLVGGFGDLPFPVFSTTIQNEAEPLALGERQAQLSPGSSLVGRASVIDGDTIEIHGQRIRFHGIDAPESSQTCRDGNGREYRCGQRATSALADKIGHKTVECEQRDVDHYKRIVAVCRQGGEDLNAWMVVEGWAMAYRQFSTDYIGQERYARTARRGIWAGAFAEPAEWRSGSDREPRPDQANDTASGQCRIKGNFSSTGERIYHVPGGQYYERTRINPANGERYFCTEDEARAAGWRRSKR
ncbi:MAG: thermonuclease family protein [Dongiaceae bacterium]